MDWLLDKTAEKYAAPLGMPVFNKTASEVSRKIVMNGCLRLELSAETLLRLLASGELCAADFRCLDCESKQCVWRLLLMSCEKTLNAGTGCNGRCSECGGSRTGDKKGPELSVLIPKRPLPAASNLDRTARQSVIFND